MGNLSLQRGPWNFWNSQTSPPDISLLLPPLAAPLPPSARPATAAHRRHRPPERHLQLPQPPTRHPLPVSTSFPSPPGLTRARHDVPEPSPAATSSPSWTARCNASTSSLSRVAALHPHPHAVLLSPASNS
jgi:hypothetical protein